MGIERTYEEINHKIRSGKAVILTAEEVLDLIAGEGSRGGEEGRRGYHGHFRAHVLLRSLPEFWTSEAADQDERSIFKWGAGLCWNSGS